MTHLRLNIWLHNSVTVSESNQYLINKSKSTLNEECCVLQCIYKLWLSSKFRFNVSFPPTKTAVSCSASKQLLHFRLFCTYNFRNHFLTIHPVWSLWLRWMFILANALKQETVLLKGTMVLLLRSWITPSGVWTYDLLLAQMFNHYSLIRCKQLVTMSVTITIHHTARHHQSSVTFVNFCSPPQTHAQSFRMLRKVCPVNTANDFQQRLV